jgi:parallel beta-helix repeat protein
MITIQPQPGDNTQLFMDARDAAGIDGRIVVTTGSYSILPIALNIAGQQWECEPGVTIFRQPGGAGSTISLSASGVRFIGGTIDNSQETATGSGMDISAIGCKIVETTIINPFAYGIYIGADNAEVESCEVYASSQIGIFAQTSIAMRGPRIHNCIVDRSTLGASISGGGIYIRGTTSGRISSPSIIGNKVILPSVSEDDAIGIEAWFSDRAVIADNQLSGGYMAISFGNMNDSNVSGNTCHDNYCYGIELAQNTFDCIVDGNIIDGSGHAIHGVICSANGTPSERNVITSNSVRRIVGAGVCVMNSKDTLIDGNKIMPGSDGVYLQSSPYSVVSNNIIIGSGSGCGVRSETPQNIVIQGNNIRSVTDGVKLESASNTVLNGNLIHGNSFSSTTSPVTLSITSPARWSGHNRIIGNAGYYRNGRSADVLDILNDCCHIWGGGNPENAVSAGPGSIYQSIDGQLYKKISGNGNTGWTLA